MLGVRSSKWSEADTRGGCIGISWQRGGRRLTEEQVNGTVPSCCRRGGGGIWKGGYLVCLHERRYVQLFLPSRLRGKKCLWICIAIIGTVEELAASQRTLTMVREQFETNFFGPVNIIKAVLPTFRERKNGHIILLTGISAAISPPT